MREMRGPQLTPLKGCRAQSSAREGRPENSMRGGHSPGHEKEVRGVGGRTQRGLNSAHPVSTLIPGVWAVQPEGKAAAYGTTLKRPGLRYERLTMSRTSGMLQNTMTPRLCPAEAAISETRLRRGTNRSEPPTPYRVSFTRDCSPALLRRGTAIRVGG
jgi:hypothetical protein